MKPFNRRVEKVLAWIANVILIVLTGFLVYGTFFKISVLKDNPEFLNLFKSELEKNPNGANLNGVNLSAEQILDYTIQGLKMYSVLLAVLVVVALLATFLMKKRILSGILFLLLAIVVAIGTVGVLIPVYLFYFIVAIMLFVRKENPQEYQETTSYL
ncbi:DUF4064 domain-containing protein [uncultured Gemella sp.]|uniref:DUF4064 domain-containing protein n=1 Tax=uncultured Gemella sp. TaxID=254352 RepID=UPI0028F15D58|nr:DUF4064 domain-containing protein [uncultured Gemella sp.]